jgi:glycosyltransferase involved in cell wall biosynthesis
MISIVTQTLNRNDLFAQALPSWLKLPVDEIIVLDWGTGPEKVLDVTGCYTDSRLKVFRCNTTERYNLNIARNIAVSLSSSKIVFLADSDIIIKENFNFALSEHEYAAHGIKPKEVYGSVLFHRWHFDALNGYNEFMQGYGPDDEDFYNRLKKFGVRQRRHISNSLIHLDHDDLSRTSEYALKSKALSARLNGEISMKYPWSIKYRRKMMEVIGQDGPVPPIYNNIVHSVQASQWVRQERKQLISFNPFSNCTMEILPGKTVYSL